MPNFFVIGAQKAGTTSLAKTLAGHPDIFFSPLKEPHFFAQASGPDPSFSKLKMPFSNAMSSIFDRFTNEPVRIAIFEELVNDPTSEIASIIDFLGCKPNPTVMLVNANQTAVHRNAGLNRFKHLLIRPRLGRMLPFNVPPRVHAALEVARSRFVRTIDCFGTPAPRITDKEKRLLSAIFEAKIDRFEELLGRDLSLWRYRP